MEAFFAIALSASVYINVTICPRDARPTGDYRWVELLPEGTLTVIYAVTKRGEVIKCVYTTQTPTAQLQSTCRS